MPAGARELLLLLPLDEPPLLDPWFDEPFVEPPPSAPVTESAEQAATILW